MPQVLAYSHKSCAEKLKGAANLLTRKLSDKKAGGYDHKSWITSVHPFPPKPADPEVFTLHVYRSNWFNESRQGIHFETFMGSKEWKKQQIQIAMHIFHIENIPGTSLKRRAVAVPFVDEIYEMVSSWDGYTFRTGKYGAHPFAKHLSFEIETFETQLSSELLKLCLELGPKMDEALKSALS